MSLRIAAQRQQSYGSIATVAQKRAIDATGGLVNVEEGSIREDQDEGLPVVGEGSRPIGVFSAVFIILNRMIGTA
jgi:hypothetical protein